MFTPRRGGEHMNKWNFWTNTTQMKIEFSKGGVYVRIEWYIGNGQCIIFNLWFYSSFLLDMFSRYLGSVSLLPIKIVLEGKSEFVAR